MQRDVERSTTPGALPPAPLERPARRRPSVRPTIVLVVVAWVVVGALLLQQQVAIDRVRLDSAEANGDLRSQLSSLTGTQSSIQRRLDGLFDPSAIVASASPSVFTLFAGGVQGSAFVLAVDATRSTLVTNYHVVRPLWKVGVRSVVLRSEERSLNGSVARVIPEVDIAVVEVAAQLPALATDRWSLEFGDPIVTLGSPHGFGGTATTGIVSAIRTRFVQLSAPVSPGSSGGPVLDADGQVVAVTAAKVVGHGVEGLSFAIPIDRVCRMNAAC